MELLLPLLIVFMIGMIFVSNRQRKKQAAQQESLQSALAVGDIVVMTSGVSGTVVDVDDERTVDVEIAPDVVTTWLRAAVREKLGGEILAEAPVDADDDDAAADADAAPLVVEPAPVHESGPGDPVEAGHTGHEHTVEGTSGVRADEPTDAPSTTGGRTS